MRVQQTNTSEPSIFFIDERDYSILPERAFFSHDPNKLNSFSSLQSSHPDAEAGRMCILGSAYTPKMVCACASAFRSDTSARQKLLRNTAGRDVPSEDSLVLSEYAAIVPSNPVLDGTAVLCLSLRFFTRNVPMSGISSLSIEMSRLTRDGTAEPVSRDKILRYVRGQGYIIFPVQLTASRFGNLARLIHTLLYVMIIHTYIHIPAPNQRQELANEQWLTSSQLSSQQCLKTRVALSLSLTRCPNSSQVRWPSHSPRRDVSRRDIALVPRVDSSFSPR